MALARKLDRDDLLTRLRIKETLVFSLIVLIAVVANLPREYLVETLRVDPTVLHAVLASLVVIALFLYLKFFVFLALVLLIVGANLPEQVAAGFGISKVPLVLALVAMVGISLINAVVNWLPTGLEPRRKERSIEGVRAMFYAIEKGNVVYAQKLLAMNFDPNLHHDNGLTPLAYAAMKGQEEMVALLLRNGADPTLRTREGDTPVELALQMGHGAVADTLRRARQEAEALGAQEGAQPSPRSDTV